MASPHELVYRQTMNDTSSCRTATVPAVAGAGLCTPEPGIAEPGIVELCIVVPVLNEAGNIVRLVERLDAVLDGIAWEVMFVDDDFTDGTRAAIGAIGARDRRVRLLHRIGRRGLASAFIEGAQASLAPTIAAMDGDLQHDEALLPQMLSSLRNHGYELAIGSRYMGSGGVGDWDRRRAGMSSFATRLSRIVLHAPVTDPMSGFFIIRRDTFERAVRNLSAMGFKILLDILASLPVPPRLIELPSSSATALPAKASSTPACCAILSC